MRHTGKIALAALLMLVSACHKVDKDAQLKALDEAYKSGVFTREEYDAKRQAILGPPAAAPAPAPAPAPVATAEPPAAAPVEVPQPTSPPPEPVATQQPVTAPAPVVAAPRQQTAPRPAPQPAPPVVNPSPPVVAPPVAAPSAPPIAQPAEAEPAPLTGCQDMEARAGGPNGVQQRFFPVSEDIARQAALKAFANLDFTIHRSDQHEIEASKKGKLNTVVGGGAERVIMHFASARLDGRPGTKVTAETKKGLVGRVTQKPWTGAVLAQISCNLRGR
jgi:hypothetical protein